MKRLLLLLSATTVTCVWAQVLTLPANGWRQGDRLTKVQVDNVRADNKYRNSNLNKTNQRIETARNAVEEGIGYVKGTYDHLKSKKVE